MARDVMPDFNPNLDAGSIRDFQSGWYPGDRPGEWGKVMHDANDPIHTHIHKHPDGMTISTFEDGKVQGRYNFNTGKQEG